MGYDISSHIQKHPVSITGVGAFFATQKEENSD